MIITPDTRVLVQGVTGRQGRKCTAQMLASGTKVVCGVTPGKAGQEVEGLPVYDAVADAVAAHAANTSVIYVPPLLVLDAALEAIDAGIALLLIVTENVPIKDAALIYERAQRAGARVIGPSSVGVIEPGVGTLGFIGVGEEAKMYSPGRIGVVSKSGGMTAETSRLLTEAGLGQSCAVGIGGDVIAGTAFTDLLALFEEDEETDAVVLFGEIGGAYEELAAEMLRNGGYTKPLVAFVGGKFAEEVGLGLALGHAGAIVEEGFGTASQKRAALRAAGALVARYHHEIPSLVRTALGGGP